MKIKILVLAMIFSLALAGSSLAEPKDKSRNSGKGKSSSSSSSAKGPRLSIKNTVYEVTDVAAGLPVNHDFILTNAGREALQIKQVAAACGCTVASYDQSIAPGQSGKVSLRVNIAPELAGRQVRQSAIIETNDPRNPYTTVTIVAHVKPAPGQEPVEPEESPEESKGKRSGEGEKTSLRKAKEAAPPSTAETGVQPETGEPETGAVIAEETKEPVPPAVKTTPPKTFEITVPPDEEAADNSISEASPETAGQEPQPMISEAGAGITAEPAAPGEDEADEEEIEENKRPKRKASDRGGR